MSITKKPFGKLDDGTAVDLYTITNKSGASLSLQTLGGGIQSLYMPDRNGKLADVVLGFDEPQPYLDGDTGFQGLLVGRYANRIRDAKFTLDGAEYNLPVNQGTWCLHGGGRFSYTIWDVKETTDNSLTFEKFSPDGEDGFPGNFTMTVKYTLTEDNTVRIEYTVTSDKKTPVNPTNHTYFNLGARPQDTIESHILKINADYFTETDPSQLMTGEISAVEGTMMDFRTAHKIGDNIDVPFRATLGDVGYDNNYCLRNNFGEFAEAATLYDEESGRKLTVYTDLPAIQLYCGGWLAKSGNKGKANGDVTYRRGVALETQFIPDSVNFPEKFGAVFVEAGKEFKTTTEFRFTAE